MASNQMDFQGIVKHFLRDGEVIVCEKFGNGHINGTYRALCKNAEGEKYYILQHINKNVFKKPELVMDNIDKVTSFIGDKVSDQREVLHFLKCDNGTLCYKDDDEEYWRMYIDKSKTFVPNGCANDLKAEGEAYDNMIKELGGIDLQLLGIGLDGHIGFNEPDEYFTAATHEVNLDESTIKANARFFAEENEVPKTAITMGMKSIMQAKKILLIANKQY